MLACEFGNTIANIHLFLRDDLDYLSVNNDGEDALAIVEKYFRTHSSFFYTANTYLSEKLISLVENITPKEKKMYLMKILSNFPAKIDKFKIINVYWVGTFKLGYY